MVRVIKNKTQHSFKIKTATKAALRTAIKAHWRKSSEMNSKPKNSESGSAHKPEDESEFKHLLQCAKTGDANALGKLLEQTQTYLLLIANEDLQPQMLQKFGASDVVQQSMLVANNKIEGFRGSTKGEFFAWMRQILINECRQTSRGFLNTAKRNVNREQGIGWKSENSPEVTIGDPHLTPSTQAANDEQFALVKQAMTRLTPVYKQVIEQRNLEERSFEEIGLAIGKTAEATRKIWSRAIIKLEKELSKLKAI